MNNIFTRWIFKLTWTNIIVWYILFTAMNIVLASIGFHYAGTLWILFTAMVMYKWKYNRIDEGYRIISK